jgi:hypothetical protein
MSDLLCTNRVCAVVYGTPSDLILTLYSNLLLKYFYRLLYTPSSTCDRVVHLYVFNYLYFVFLYA